MDNHIFRSAISGFNRQDVMEYIEKTQKEAAENVQRLEEENEELRRNESALKWTLDECVIAKADVTQKLEEMTASCEEAKANWENQAKTAEMLRTDVKQRDESIRELTVENQKLNSRLGELENEIAVIRQEKEQIAQLELEARKRCEEILAAAQAQAESMVSDAGARADEMVKAAREDAQNTTRQAAADAQETVSNAQNQAKQLTDETTAYVARMRNELAEQVAAAVNQYNSLQSAVETITNHVSGELRKLNVTVAQLPINFDHMKDSLQDLMERTKGE